MLTPSLIRNCFSVFVNAEAVPGRANQATTRKRASRGMPSAYNRAHGLPPGWRVRLRHRRSDRSPRVPRHAAARGFRLPGDLARLPYGPRPLDEIRRYAGEIAGYLEAQ